MRNCVIHSTHAYKLGFRHCHPTCSLIPRPYPQKEEESGDIGANSWFYKLSNHVIVCIGCMCNHVMVRKTKKKPPISPDPFLVYVIGSGNKTILHVVISWE